jgi:GNAT superfamily N-acetyltransferase
VTPLQPEIRSPVTAAEWQAYYAFRWQWLRAPWQQPPGSERDQLEDTALHAMALLEDAALCGVGRLHRLDPATAQIRYMAVAPDFQGRGIGRALLAWLETRARQDGVTTIRLAAREPSVGFYHRLGYRDCGAAHTLFGSIRHRWMEKGF